MLRSRKVIWWAVFLISLHWALLGGDQERACAGVTSEEVERAIRQGVRFLIDRQRPDGSWPDMDRQAPTGPTSLATLALLTAGEKPNSPVIQRALAFLRQFTPDKLNSTYAISLQTMVFAAAEP